MVVNLLQQKSIAFSLGTPTGASSSGGGSSPSGSIAIPSGIIENDVLVLFLGRSNTAGLPTLSIFGAPVHSQAQGGIYTHLCDGSETGSVTITIGGSAKWSAVCVPLRGLAGLSEVGWASQNAVSPTTDISYPTITPSGQPSYIFYVGYGAVADSNSAINPGGTNPTPELILEQFNTSSNVKVVVFGGDCTSTSALGDRTVQETGFGANFYNGATLGLLK